MTQTLESLMLQILREVHTNLGYSPHVSDVPMEDFEYRKTTLYLRKDTLDEFEKMARMAGISNQKLLESILNAVGTYIRSTEAEDRH